MFKDRLSIVLTLVLMFLVSVAIMGCGGDSSSNQDDGDSTSKVALFLADGPADDFDHIWIEVSEISLLPSGDGAPVVIYETDDPERIDLLTLREDDLLLAVNSSVPADTYQKIRLTVDSVEGQQDGQSIDFHLSSGKIDLNPKGTITVTPGQTLSLRLDIDAEKSIHVAGPNYNFRPVVFVDAGPMNDPRPCPHLIKGEITELLYPEEDDETVIGFRITPFNANATLDVYLQEDTVIFDDSGELSSPEAFAVGQIVSIKGKLATDGRFLADMVIIGEVQTLSGVVESSVDDQNHFLVNPGFHWDDPMLKGNIMSDDDLITVALSDGTMIQLDGAEAGADQIQPGLKTRIVGKMDAESDIMKAIAVFLKARQIAGILTNIEATEGGNLLTIRTAMGIPHDPTPDEGPAAKVKNKEACFGDEEITIFLPDTAAISVKGGTELTLDELAAIVACKAPRVQVQIDSSVEVDGALQASALVVWPQFVKMAVASVDLENSTITAASGATLLVPEDTPIWLWSDDAQKPIELGDIAAGDVLLVAALKTCEPTDYSAVVIVKMPGCEPPDPDDTCWPQYKRIELTVTEVGENILIGEKETSVAVTDETVYIDQTQIPPQEMEFEDIAVGNTLVCHILSGCDDEPDRALVVAKVNPKGGGEGPGPDDCIPEIDRMEVVVETVADAALQTTEGDTIQVPTDTPIYEITKNGFEALTFADLETDDVLEIMVMQSCEDDILTALLIFRHAK